ncbi:MAG TPA: hypothetical protein VK718_03420 [Ferruginibacter sp.]|jgi:hypothetical protein|nr:hypothetical protein [Ferruginibacter sp.]
MKRYTWLAYLIIVFVFCLALWGTYNQRATLRKNHLVVCARILSITISRGSNHVNFEFLYNGKIINDNNGTCLDRTMSMFHNGEMYYILLVVSKSDPYINDFIEDQEDFKKYNISTQDTLGVLCNHVSGGNIR